MLLGLRAFAPALIAAAKLRSVALGPLIRGAGPRLSLGLVLPLGFPPGALGLGDGPSLSLLQLAFCGLQPGELGLVALGFLGLQTSLPFRLSPLGILRQLPFPVSLVVLDLLRLSALLLFPLTLPAALPGAPIVEADVLAGVEGMRSELDIRRALARSPPQIAGLDPGVEGIGVALGR